MKNAPSDKALQAELLDRVFRLSTLDCLRADKMSMANAIEVKNFLKIRLFKKNYILQ